MEKKNSLQKSQQQGETSIKIFDKKKIQMSLAVAFERTATDPFNIDGMVKDVTSYFKDIEEDTIIAAIKEGSLGKYGRTYRLCTQEIFLWIRKYLDENEPSFVR